ncbi:hypothetical protein P168DRAFT_300699 [Aspergillus campestris IBT 28561]|uniref:Protein YAE1 n=1 Tax=Aspergillus campestris (strain IBT 28561) TaxID=1392248 RepID=A0A2I1DDH3_ASPC2|nr:uncharacterized protein P168DRAFT_300699 [Aspergillus campestris IBT 28561]PKY07900.1 hypothetical protein P168DRAFT_300699 [Aspergillus campestris IBT 28561]
MDLETSYNTHPDPTTSSPSSLAAPHSPTATMTPPSEIDAPPPAGTASTNALDDIFGSSPPTAPSTTTTAQQPSQHDTPTSNEPSELPSLRRQHVTAGYRDGIAASKGEHVQDGFDAGFPVGAQLGMRAGTVLGILEGLVRGFEARVGGGAVKKIQSSSTSGDGDAGVLEEERRAKKEEILALYRRAVRELDVRGVFAGADEALRGDGPGEKEEKGEKKQPEDRLAKTGAGVVEGWETRVRVARWEENMEALEEKDPSLAELS